ncbi:hypothetical protein ACFV4F_40835 [Kitasatospora sp. NPDC059722]|uniref:hypothetical protein n=1 Tax=unclassified Kitasatospora TaxID=2633591 RepID=UPI00364881C6
MADGTDLLLTAFGPAPLGRTAGEALGVPVIGAYLVPAIATAEFPLPNARDTGAGNLAAGRDVLQRAERAFAGAATRLRALFGLPADPSRGRGAAELARGIAAEDGAVPLLARIGRG